MKVFSKTPVRLGLIGGGTDLPTFTKNNTGHVINCAISLYNYVFIEYFISDSFSLEVENVNENIRIKTGSLDDPNLLNNFIIFVPTTLKYLSKLKGFEIKGNFKIKIESEIERGSGLGGSSSVLVGILNALNQVLKLNLTKHELAESAFEIERKILKIEGGAQDFYTAAFGGMNFMHFKKEDTTLVNKIEISSKKVSLLESHILLFYTGIRREAKIIEKEKSGLLKESSKLKSMQVLADLTKTSIEHIEKKFDIQKFSKCLDKSWELKKQSSGSVSNQIIDDIISIGKDCGAYCGKISGAGSGGYGFFIIDPSRRKNLADSLSKRKIKTYFIKVEERGTTAYYI